MLAVCGICVGILYLPLCKLILRSLHGQKKANMELQKCYLSKKKYVQLYTLTHIWWKIFSNLPTWPQIFVSRSKVLKNLIFRSCYDGKNLETQEHTSIKAWFCGLPLPHKAKNYFLENNFHWLEFVLFFQIYVNNKAQIDPVLDQVKAKLTEVSDKVTALMPQAKAVAAEPKKEE